jgi:protein gp37
MGETTRIEWAKSTASPWTVCTEINDECSRCYAKALTRRYRWGAKETAGQWGVGIPRHKFKNFGLNMRKLERDAAREGRTNWRVFPSLCDIFDEEAPAEWREEYFSILEACPHLTHLILTKRPQFMHEYMTARYGGNPLPNVWLLISAGRQKSLNESLPWLQRTAAVVRGVSAEPLLEPLTFPADHKIDWVIIGGESSQKPYIDKPPRPCDVEWIDSIIKQLHPQVKIHVKQLGSTPVVGGIPMVLRGKGGEMEEWPDFLRVREYPI